MILAMYIFIYIFTSFIFSAKLIKNVKGGLMFPILHIGSLQIPVYGSIIAIAYIAGVFLMSRRAVIYGFRKRDIYIVSISSMAGIIVGAKLFYFFTVLPDYIRNCNAVRSDLYGAIYYGFSGFVFYGGIAGALFMIFLYCVRHEYSFLKFTNVIIPVVPFIHALGRIGCFMGGCCYGVKYNGIFSVQFPKDSLIENLGAFPRFPIQLLEAASLFALFIIMYSHSSYIYPKGYMLRIYLCAYSIIRFMTEFLRGDTYRGIFFSLSTGQWISIFIFIGTFSSFLIQISKRQPPIPD